MSKTVTKTSVKTKTATYDVAEQLRTPEEMAAFRSAKDLRDNFKELS